MRVFLNLNGTDLKASAQEIVNLTLDIEAKKAGIKEITDWLKKHAEKEGLVAALSIFIWV